MLTLALLLPGQGKLLAQAANALPDKLDQEIARNQHKGDLRALSGSYRKKAAGASSERVRAGYLEKALKLEKQLNRNDEILELHRLLANSYTSIYDYDNALIHSFELLRLYKHTGNTLKIAQTHSAIGSLYDNKLDDRRAFEHYRKALRMAAELGSKQGEAAILNNMTGMYLRMDSTNAALSAVRRAMELNRSTGNNYWISINHLALCDIYAQLSDYDSMRYYLEKTSAYDRIHGTASDSIELLRKWGIYFLRTGNLHRAVDFFNRGVLLSRRIGSLKSEANYIHWLSEAYDIHGQTELAMSYLQTHYDLLDSLRKEQNTDLLEGLSILYNVGQVQDSLHTALLESDVILKEVERKNTLLYGIALVALLLLTLLVYGYLQYRKKVHTNELLLRLQLEPAQNKTKYAQSNLSDTTRNQIVEALEALMHEEQLYRNQELTLSMAAEKLNISRTYLSQVINESFGQNFTSYVNDFRIDLAKRYFSDRAYDKYAISGIAEMVGFRSLSSFNTSFKKTTGLTPSYFRKHS